MYILCSCVLNDKEPQATNVCAYGKSDNNQTLYTCVLDHSMAQLQVCRQQQTASSNNHLYFVFVPIT